ncbi:uncharacterized protein A4U43_UnF1080 [Asparagus officinalis]|uniref:Uncharacterized protein n=1 Tax=Asparagus officinalis TaxID=4686 RepID=A0A1R3L7P6_ASPOF|nr:uncharacterized protein A4U43_UnF1080 [Asparagus officinalis]
MEGDVVAGAAAHDEDVREVRAGSEPDVGRAEGLVAEEEEGVDCLFCEQFQESSASTRDVLRTADDALSGDIHEAIRQIGSISAICFGPLQTLQGDHTEKVMDIRSLAERCPVKEYLVALILYINAGDPDL